MATRKKSNDSPTDEIPHDEPLPIPDGSSAGGAPVVTDGLGNLASGVAVKQAPKHHQVLAPATLAPKLDGSDGVAQRFKYWIGILPDCPVQGISAAGHKFSKLNEIIIPNRELVGRTQRQGVPGGIVSIDRETMLKLRDVLPRIVIRFEQEPPAPVEVLEGNVRIQTVADNAKETLRGRLITIPTEETIRVAKEKGRPVRRYVPHPNDRPAIRWMFMQLCSDQVHGSRSVNYPLSIEQTGIVWPGDPIDD
jgi:hypothetical protein